MDRNKLRTLTVCLFVCFIEALATAHGAAPHSDLVSRLLGRTSPDTRAGIGIDIRNEDSSGEILVVLVAKGSPAHEQGIRVGDVITEASRDKDARGDVLPRPVMIPTKSLGRAKMVDLLLGELDTKLRLVIRREGVKTPVSVNLVRKGVRLESVFGRRRKTDEEWDFMIDPKAKIGYIRVSSFSRNTYRDLQTAVGELKKQGVKALVFDLRSNPGGLLDSAIKVASLFVDDRLIVSIRPRGGPRRWVMLDGVRTGPPLDFPMACLVNGQAARISEIAASALQDHKRARLFGERTPGDGGVQNIEDIDVNDPRTGKELRREIKYTSATFGRPNGKDLDRDTADDPDEWGVTPDEIIAITPHERRALEGQWDRDRSVTRKDSSRIADRQLDAALKYLRSRIGTSG